MSFLADLKEPTIGENHIPEPVTFSEDDDLDLCLYYLQSLVNVLRTCGDVAWGVLASKHVSSTGEHMHISSKMAFLSMLRKILTRSSRWGRGRNIASGLLCSGVP